jgi:probable rRNA maturation factor
MRAPVVETEISVEALWPDDDWQNLADMAVAAALNVAPFSRLTETRATVSVSIRFADKDEVQALNRDYRHKDKPTNILSFPMLSRDMIDLIANTDDGEILLGDMILAYQICAAEAAQKAITLPQHVSHLIVHGTLHLLGFDHIDDIEADHMEALEVKALASLGICNPYTAIDDNN